MITHHGFFKHKLERESSWIYENLHVVFIESRIAVALYWVENRSPFEAVYRLGTLYRGKSWILAREPKSEEPVTCKCVMRVVWNWVTVKPAAAAATEKLPGLERSEPSVQSSAGPPSDLFRRPQPPSSASSRQKPIHHHISNDVLWAKTTVIEILWI